VAVRVAALVVSVCFGLPMIAFGLFLALNRRLAVVRFPQHKRLGLLLVLVGVGGVISGVQRLTLNTPAGPVLLGVEALLTIAMLVILVRLFRDRTPS
jgi:hypothetical protein